MERICGTSYGIFYSNIILTLSQGAEQGIFIEEHNSRSTLASDGLQILHAED